MVALFKMARSAQLSLEIPCTWGGKRKNAGRPPIEGRRRPTPHRARLEHKTRHPVHVTMRVRAELTSLRSPRTFPVIRGALSTASNPSFRVVHFSVQSDHVHLIVEAHDTITLARGVLGLATRIARRVNRALGRTGRFWGDRYHARPLTTPRETRHGLVYVLRNDPHCTSWLSARNRERELSGGWCSTGVRPRTALLVQARSDLRPGKLVPPEEPRAAA
jgi:putative transposase